MCIDRLKMQSIGFGQPTSASAQFFKLCARVLQPTQKRHAASYRRARSKLNIKPDPSFLPSKIEAHDHIIYNPPPSMPNVYHTPTIFLPKDDRRRAIQAALEPTSQVAVAGTLPPPVSKPYEKRYHLNEEDIREMKRLRREDPDQWSATQLQKKFDCSGVFVRFVIRGMSKEKMEQQKLVSETVKSNWGIKRRVAREDRAIRKEKWFRDA